MIPCHRWLVTACAAVVVSVPLDLAGVSPTATLLLRGMATLAVVRAAKHVMKPPPGRARLGLYLLDLAGVTKIVLAFTASPVAAWLGFAAGGVGQLVVAYGVRGACGDGLVTRILVWLAWWLAAFGFVMVVWPPYERIQTALSITWFLLSVIPIWRRAAAEENHEFARRTNLAPVSPGQ